MSFTEVWYVKIKKHLLITVLHLLCHVSLHLSHLIAIFFVEGSTLYHIDIVHTDDGLKELSALRKLEENQYAVRKVLCERNKIVKSEFKVES